MILTNFDDNECEPRPASSLYLKPHQQRHDDKNDEYGTSTPASYSCSTELELLRIVN